MTSRRIPSALDRLLVPSMLALPLVAVTACSGAASADSPTPVDGGGDVGDALGSASDGAIDAGSSERDAIADGDAAAPLCRFVPVSNDDLCEPGTWCPIERAIGVQCSWDTRDLDLAASPGGHALVALLSGHDAVALDVPRQGEATLIDLGRAVAAAPAFAPQDETPRVLLSPSPPATEIARQVGGSWRRDPVEPVAPFKDFALVGETEGFALSVEGTYPPEVSWNADTKVSLASIPAGNVRTPIAEGNFLALQLLLDRSTGNPSVAYAQHDFSTVRVRHWERGVTKDIATFPLLGGPPPLGWQNLSAALRPNAELIALHDRGGDLLSIESGAEAVLYDAPDWTRLMCRGGPSVAQFPNICPSGTSDVQSVGERATNRHAIASGNGKVWYAVATWDLAVGCVWQSSGCIETLPCYCNELERALLPYAAKIRVRDLDVEGREIVLGVKKEWAPDTRLDLAVDDAGLLYVAWGGSRGMTLVVLDPRTD